MGKLTDKVAIITGASGGIGSAAAALFSREGASLVLTGRDEHRLRQAAEACDPARTRTVVADITREADVARIVDAAVQAFGGVDVLFANAGDAGPVCPIGALDIAALDDMYATTVRGTFLTIQKVIPSMTARGGGSIVVSSSVGAITGIPGIAPYAMCKAALEALVRTATSELASAGIRVNSIVAGPVDNRMLDNFLAKVAPGHEAAARAGLAQTIPARRLPTSEEIARMAVFLASEDSSYCYGSSFVVDGGRTAV